MTDLEYEYDDEPETEVTSEVGPWAMVPVWVLSKGLSPSELAVYIALRSFADRQGKARPKARTIAERAQVAVGTARNAIQALRDKRLLTTTEVRRDDGSLAGLRYRLCDIDPTPGFVAEARKPRGTRGKGSRTKVDSEEAPPTPAPLGVGVSIDSTPAPSGAGGSAPSGAGVDTKQCTQEHTKRTHQVGTPSVPPSEERRESGQIDGSSIQTALVGADRDLTPQAPTTHDIAMGVARKWMIEWKDRLGTDIAGTNVQHRIRSAVEQFLTAGNQVDDVKNAMIWAAMGVPEKGMMEAGLAEVAKGWRAPKDWVPGDRSVRNRGHRAGGRRRGDNGPMAGTNLHIDDLSPEERAARNPFKDAVRSSDVLRREGVSA